MPVTGKPSTGENQSEGKTEMENNIKERKVGNYERGKHLN